jgi:DNA primase
MAPSAVEQIKEKLSIVDVVAPYVQLQSAGKNLKGKSPFTNEKTPSFYVSPDRGMFYCFSSSKGGDIFTFIQEIEGVDFKGALKQLADRAGVQLVAEDPKFKTERERLYALLEEATQFYGTKRAESPAAEAYLESRGLSKETIERWRIGYAPGPPQGGWREVATHLQSLGYTQAECLKAGLVKGAEVGKDPYDVFRDRIMFPLFDSSGRVVAFSGRILTSGTEAPKYVNSPETELYHKSDLLYGYDKAKQGIRHLNFSLIVEGQFDVVMSHQAGYQNTVAVSGTALTPHHVDLLQRLSMRTVLALDSDRAGISAIKRSAELMLGRGMDVKVARFADGADPADIIKVSPGAFKRAVGNATHIVEFLLDVVQRNTKDSRSYTLAVREEVLPFVAKIPSRLDQEYFIGVVAEHIASTKDAVRSEVERIQKNLERESIPLKSVNEAPPEALETTHPKIKEKKNELLEYVAVAITQKLIDESTAEIISSRLESHFGIVVVDFSKAIPTERVSELTFKIESRQATSVPKQWQREVLDVASQLLQLGYAEKIDDLREQLKMAEYEKDENKVADILLSISTLQKQKQEKLLN